MVGKIANAGKTTATGSRPTHSHHVNKTELNRESEIETRRNKKEVSWHSQIFEKSSDQGLKETSEHMYEHGWVSGTECL